MPQNYIDRFDGKTALEFLLPEPDKIKEGRIRKMMGALKFNRQEMMYPQDELSGGQKAKLFLLKMVVDECNVLLLDEPTRNLSPLSVQPFFELINNFKGTVIAITHDRKFINNCFDVIMELDKNGLNEVAK